MYEHLREEKMNWRGSLSFGGGRSSGWRGPRGGGRKERGGSWIQKLDPEMADLLPTGRQMEKTRRKIGEGEGMKAGAKRMAGYLRARRWKMMGYSPDDPPVEPEPYPIIRPQRY